MVMFWETDPLFVPRMESSRPENRAPLPLLMRFPFFPGTAMKSLLITWFAFFKRFLFSASAKRTLSCGQDFVGASRFLGPLLEAAGPR